MESKQAVYYAARDDFNERLANNDYSVHCAALLIFLNKAGYNGVYRVNLKGKYNVPFGYRNEICCYDPENIKAVADALSNAKITADDWKTAASKAHNGDLVFLDPPYHKTFTKYTQSMFSDQDQKDVADAFNHLSDIGAYAIATNNADGFAQSLYQGYNQEVVDTAHYSNSDGSGRRAKELIVTNYTIDQNDKPKLIY